MSDFKTNVDRIIRYMIEINGIIDHKEFCMEINTQKFVGYIGMKINDCKLNNKIDNVVIDKDYKDSFYEEYGNKKITDCKIFMQGKPGTFFILNNGEIISTKMFI